MHGPNNSAHTHKPSDTTGTVKRLIKYIGKQKSLLVGMIVFVIISSVATVMASVFIQPIVDDLLIPAVGQEFSWALFKPITKILIMLVCAAIIGAGASYGK